jgi:hypothetical protein
MAASRNVPAGKDFLNRLRRTCVCIVVGEDRNFFMTKKYWILLVFAGVLAVAYVVYFTTWFRTGPLQIYHTCRILRVRAKATPPPPVLIFVLDRPLGVKELKVVDRSAYQTNQNTLPLWHLISDSNSVPIKTFTYGQPIRGMKPRVSGSRPDSLETNTVYRLIVEAGALRGEHDFKVE